MPTMVCFEVGEPSILTLWNWRNDSRLCCLDARNPAARKSATQPHKIGCGRRLPIPKNFIAKPAVFLITFIRKTI